MIHFDDRFHIASLCLAVCLAGGFATNAFAQNQQGLGTPTFQINSNLVFLDVTVLDKKGDPVVTGLTKNDFSVTEDKKPQKITSFEPPQVHLTLPNSGNRNPNAKVPLTIFVLDQLNSSFSSFAYIRYEMRRFLLAQPETLNTPAELMVIGNQSLSMLQGYTRSRADLLAALNRVPTALPVKRMNPSFFWERFEQSMDALQQIALQNRGVPGRKNIVWVGHGGPGVNLIPLDLPGQLEGALKDYVHATTNMLVDARTSLFVIYPGLSVRGRNLTLSTTEADADIGDEGDPFAGDINFGVMVNETGGKLFFNRNDVDHEIRRSQTLGENYYTLTYQPGHVEPDGKFRRIRVKLRNPNLHVVTKAGYYAPNEHSFMNPRQLSMMKLAEAIQSSIPLNSLGVSVQHVIRHPDTQTVEFTVQLQARNLHLLPVENGKYAANMRLAIASLNAERDIKVSTINAFTVLTSTADFKLLPDVVSKLDVKIHEPRDTSAIRVVIEDQDGGRIGAAELNRKTIDAAPTSAPQLVKRAPPATTSGNQQLN